MINILPGIALVISSNIEPIDCINGVQSVTFRLDMAGRNLIDESSADRPAELNDGAAIFASADFFERFFDGNFASQLIESVTGGADGQSRTGHASGRVELLAGGSEHVTGSLTGNGHLLISSQSKDTHSTDQSGLHEVVGRIDNVRRKSRWTGVQVESAIYF